MLMHLICLTRGTRSIYYLTYAYRLTIISFCEMHEFSCEREEKICKIKALLDCFEEDHNIFILNMNGTKTPNKMNKKKREEMGKQFKSERKKNAVQDYSFSVEDEVRQP